MKRNIFTLAATLSLGFSAVACTNAQSGEAQTQASNVAQSETSRTATDDTKKESPIKHIDARYMRENIFDYKANPTKFVFKGKKPAILDFYADWCGPCRQLSPRLETLAKKYAGKIDVYKINIDDETELAKVFGVQSIPMLLFINTDGSTPSVSQGALSYDDLETEVNTLFKIK